MAFEVGLVTEFDDVVAVHEPDVLATAKVIDLAANQGRFYQLMKAPSAAITQKKFEVYSRSLSSMAGVVGNGSGSGWADSGTTSLVMTAAAIKPLTVGTVIKIENEVVVIKSVNRTANTVDVFARGAGGTSAAAHADTTAYTVVGFAGNDTDLKNVESLSESTLKYENYCQTVFQTVDYTKMEQLLGRKGLDENHVAILKAEAMKRMAAKLAAMSIHGLKQAGSETVPFMSAGLLAQLVDTASATRPILRYNAGSTAFTETILKAALEDVFERGNPNVILCSQSKKNIINDFNGAFINTERTDKVAGYSIKQYEYEERVLDIVVDQDMPSDRVAILTLDKCQKGWLSGDVLRYENEPPSSSRENRDSLQGSIGFLIEGVGYDHIDIYGLT